MKRILLSSIFNLLVGSVLFSQPYFQATFVNPANPSPPPATINQLSFRMKPTAAITTEISYMQFALRYPTATTPPFTIAITSNTVNFPTLNIKRVLPDYVEGAYTYITFVHNSSVISSATYASGVEKEVFKIELLGAAAIAPSFDLVTDIANGNYYFTVVDGAANPIDPGASSALYGTGYSNNGGVETVPLTNVPVPVKFLDFTAAKKSNSAVLSWSVENESSITDRYEVEMGTTPDNLKKIAVVLPKNNGRSANVYEFTHNDISAIVSYSGAIYYRITQFDKDGKSASPGVKSIRIDGKSFGISAYPNPVKGSTNLTIDLVAASNVIITMTDASGKLVRNTQIKGFKGQNIHPISMEKYAGGNYMLKVQAGNETRTMSITKVN
jgi:hypothetical protein